MMVTNENILEEYHRQATWNPPAGSKPFVIRIDKHTFIECEVEVSGKALLIRLGEAFPNYEPGKPISVTLQTKSELQRQVLNFLNLPEDAV
jgi:hypothetical protein